MKIYDGITYTFINGSALIGTDKSDVDSNALSDQSITNVRIRPKIGSYLVLTIGCSAFRRSNIKSIWIPRTVEVMKFDCLAYTNYLTSVEFEIGSNLREMHQGVFYKASALRVLKLPSRLQNISLIAFEFTSLDELFYYGMFEIQGSNIFDNVVETFPKKIFVCKQATFNHFGEVTTLEKVLNCDALKVYRETNDRDSWSYLFVLNFLKSIYIVIALI